MGKSTTIAMTIGLTILLAACGSRQRPQLLACEQSLCSAKSQRIESMRIIQAEGARPHFAATSEKFVFDRKNADGYYDLYISDLNGNILRSLTDGKTDFPQKNNGNGVFDPSGEFVIFVLEAASHFADQVKSLGDSGVGLFIEFVGDRPGGLSFLDVN